MFDIILTFIRNNMFNSDFLSDMLVTIFGKTISINYYLSVITTIIIMVLFIIALVKLVIWTFKIISRGMTLR